MLCFDGLLVEEAENLFLRYLDELTNIKIGLVDSQMFSGHFTNVFLTNKFKSTDISAEASFDFILFSYLIRFSLNDVIDCKKLSDMSHTIQNKMTSAVSAAYIVLQRTVYNFINYVILNLSADHAKWKSGSLRPNAVIGAFNTAVEGKLTDKEKSKFIKTSLYVDYDLVNRIVCDISTVQLLPILHRSQAEIIVCLADRNGQNSQRLKSNFFIIPQTTIGKLSSSTLRQSMFNSVLVLISEVLTKKIVEKIILSVDLKNKPMWRSLERLCSEVNNLHLGKMDIDTYNIEDFFCNAFSSDEHKSELHGELSESKIHEATSAAVSLISVMDGFAANLNLTQITVQSKKEEVFISQ
jgi:hypothetical protein